MGWSCVVFVLALMVVCARADKAEFSPYPDTHLVKSCSPHEYKCDDGSCVNVGLVCDGFADCADGADETGCVDGTEIVRLSPKKRCVLPPYPAHGNYTANIRNAKPGDAYDIVFLEVTCLQGYSVKGFGIISCYDGKWRPNMPTCVMADLCTLSYSIGNCSEYQAKWYFDTKYQRCRQFYFGGCGGNGNKFDTEQECLQRCSLPPATTTELPSGKLTAATTLVPQITVPANCKDNPYFANCSIIVQHRVCEMKYYARFCCKSCLEAGQLRVNSTEDFEPFKNN